MPGRSVIPALCLMLCITTAIGGDRIIENWPEGWQRAYARFQAFVDARDESWPSSRLKLNEDGTLTFEVPAPVRAGGICGMQPFREGFTALARRHTKPLNLAEKFYSPRTYTVCVNGFTSFGYLHFPPLLHVEVSEDEKGEIIQKVVELEKPEDYWPNWRGLLFEDYNEVNLAGSRHIVESNSRVRPEVRLQVDGQAGIHTTSELNSEEEKLLVMRSYRNGRRLTPNPTFKNSIIDGNSGAGHYLVFMCVEGPEGYMPVSNYLTYYVYPEADRSEHSIIVAKDTDGDGISDFTEKFYGLDPEKPSDRPGHLDPRVGLEVMNYWEFIPGYFGGRPWVIGETESQSQ